MLTNPIPGQEIGVHISHVSLKKGENQMRRRAILSIIASLCLFGASACNSDSPTGTETAVEGLRRDFAQYQDLAKANAAGYTTWSPDPRVAGSTCPSAPEGKMGYHLLNVSARGSAATPASGDAVIDPLRPEMLLYEKKADGSMVLVGVEWIVFKAAWEREKGVGAAAPTVIGQTMPLSDHTFVTGGPSIPHYEMHAWIFRDNPRGMFEHYNPNITC